LLGLSDDLIAARMEEITFGLGVFFGFQNGGLVRRCRQNSKTEKPRGYYRKNEK
jgi:hypothetical protein